jgi:DNA-directed RNA polymerase subunit RPC12/RpoP
MADRVRSADTEIPVVCSLCGTRMYTSRQKIGSQITCPDCHTRTVVKEPPPKPEPTKPKYTGEEYALRESDAPTPTGKDESYVKVTCRLCGTLTQIRTQHVGKRFKCPDCGTANVVPPPDVDLSAFRLPDVSDVQLDEPPPEADNKRKEIADRLMAEATDHVRRIREEQPQPTSPVKTKPAQFVFRLNILPVWVGGGIAVLVLWALVDLVNSLMANVSWESIMAAFVVVITAMSMGVFAAIFIPQLFTIAVFTSEGHDRIPYWPSLDLLERLRAVLFAVNSFAVASIPGMMAILLVRSLGVPTWVGLPVTLIFMPIVCLSMLEADSPFAPYSKRIKDSLSKYWSSWSSFYYLTCGLAFALVVLCVVGYLLTPLLGRVLAAFGGSAYAVIYSHAVGRLAWVLGEPETDELEAMADDSPGR